MIYVVITFLWLSILLYLLLGGADFGAGIVELLTPRSVRSKMRTITYNTIGPIWEANHMWLIIVIVILFVGFPSIYSALSIYLHIPLMLMLLGIIGRGTAFIFRHYDAVKDDTQRIYNTIFMYSSLVTPFFLGTIAGGMVSGSIDPAAEDFYAAYMRPWTNIFSISVGVFTASICGFLAAVYLVGEDRESEIRRIFINRAILLNILTVIAGVMVFIAARIEGIGLMEELLRDPVTLIVLLMASASLFFLWYFLRHRHAAASRITAGFQVTAILFALGYHYFPDFIILKTGENLSLYNAAATEGPIRSLAWALLVGSVFILPSLFYLVYSFQKSEKEKAISKVDNNKIE